MQYLCLIYENETEWDKLPPAESAKTMDEYFAYTDSIRKSGHYAGGNALQPTRTATTVRIRRGKVATTDGPFAETKEQLGGFYLLECENLDEAIEWAAKIPGAQGGSIELRPVMDYEAAGAQEHDAAARA